LRSRWWHFLSAVLLGAWGCAVVVGFGLEAFKLLPYSIIALAVFLNNAMIALLLGPLLLKLLAPRVHRWDLYWQELMDEEDRLPGPAPRLGQVLAWLGAGGGFGVGLALSTGLLAWPGQPSLILTLSPFIFLLLVGCVLW